MQPDCLCMLFDCRPSPQPLSRLRERGSDIGSTKLCWRVMRQGFCSP